MFLSRSLFVLVALLVSSCVTRPQYSDGECILAKNFRMVCDGRNDATASTIDADAELTAIVESLKGLGTGAHRQWLCFPPDHDAFPALPGCAPDRYCAVFDPPIDACAP